MYAERPFRIPPMSRRNRMGEVYAKATFRGPTGTVERLELLVDTGSSYSCIPAEAAERLGVQPLIVLPFDLGQRRNVRRRVGEAEVEILGRRATRLVVFARPEEEPVIGHDTLQGLLMHIDMIRHLLVPGFRLRAPSRRLVSVSPKTRRGSRAGA